MTRPVRLRPQVEAEVIAAMSWYADRSPGLGVDFYDIFRGVLTSIAEAPERYRRVRGDVRRVVFRRFPYALFYIVEDAEVIVLACIHERRSPDRWPLQRRGPEV